MRENELAAVYVLLVTFNMLLFDYAGAAFTKQEAKDLIAVMEKLVEQGECQEDLPDVAYVMMTAIIRARLASINNRPKPIHD